MENAKLYQKLVRGFVSLTARKIALDTINFLAIFVFLAKLLPINIIGVYAIAQSILSFFSYFQDIGLGAALIQKKEISKDDLKTTFTIQEVLVGLLSIIIIIMAPNLGGFYNLDDGGIWLIRALGFSFFLTSLKVIPSNLLERQLRFEPIVIVDIIETLIFNGLLIYLTLNNYGIWAYTYAVVARSVVGVIIINLISPWGMSLGFSRVATKELINFGIPFQLNSILALLKDRLTPLITAKIIGDVGVGYLTWAQGIAFRPLEVMSIVIRVTFPSFARLQDEKDLLKGLIEKSLFLTGLIIYPLLLGMVAILPGFIAFMGKEKFLPAVPLIYLFIISALWAAPSTILTNVLTAVGRVGITLKLMIMWTILTWILSPILAIYYGYLGVALASAIISFSSIIPIIIVTKIIKINVFKSLYQPLIASILMALSIYLIGEIIDKNVISLVSLVIGGAIIYLTLISLIAKNRILVTIKEFRDV